MESKIQRRQTERLQIRVTPATKERLLAICTATGKSQAELIRQWADGRKVVSKSEAKVLAELRRQGGLIKSVLIDLRKRECLTDQLHDLLEDALHGIGQATEQIIRGDEHDFTPN